MCRKELEKNTVECLTTMIKDRGFTPQYGVNGMVIEGGDIRLWWPTPTEMECRTENVVFHFHFGLKTDDGFDCDALSELKVYSNKEIVMHIKFPNEKN